MAFSIFFILILGSIIGNSSWGEEFYCLWIFPPTSIPHPQAVDIRITTAVALSNLVICSGIGGFIFKKQDIK